MTINISFEGNLTEDPSLRFTPSGAAVANFTVAHTPRRFDKAANEWKDDETIFLRCTCWQEMAEHVSETLTRGMSVMVSGKLGARTWETKEGQKRTDFEVTVDNIGPSLKRATAKVTKSERSSGPALSGNVVQPGGEDPWATQTTTVSSAGYPRQATGWGTPTDGAHTRVDTEPPF